MKPRTYAYIGGTLLAASILAIAGLGPLGEAAPSTTPVFAVDPSWPNPLPAPVGSDGVAHTWVTGEIAGSCTDRNDNVLTFNRGWEVGVTINGVLQGNNSGAINGNDSYPFSAIPSPPVVEYDSVGNAIAGWGNPSLIQTGVDYGYAAYLPQGAHGCYVDYQGNIWLGGNGDGIVQKYNPMIAAAEGASATYVLQIGTKGMCDGTPTTTNPFSSCGETNDNNTSHTLLNEPPDIAVDPSIDPVTGKRGSIYIADGYGNHRVVVFNADGTYSRQWGTKCMINGAPASGQNCPPGTFGATGGGHPHCVVLGNDGNVYVCDRPNSRIQVFDRSCGAASDPSTGSQPICQPKRIINIGLNAGSSGVNAFENAAPADTAAIVLATNRACDMDFWPNIDYLATKSPTNQSVIVDVDLNNNNTWLLNKATGIVFGALGACGLAPCPGHNAAHFAYGHMTNVDSKGNIYVSETITGRRIQKFVPVK